MSFATFRIVLFARTRDDGTRPIYLRLTYKGKSKYFPLGLHAIPANWDKKLCRFTRDFPEYKKENDLLRTYEQRAADALRDFRRDGVAFSFDRFESAVFGATSDVGPTLSAYIRRIASEFTQDGRIGNAEKYTVISGVIEAYRPNAGLSDIDVHWLEKFERHLRRDRGNSPGGIAFTMRTLRAVCNRAIRAGDMPESWYPFRVYKIAAVERESGAKALSLDDIRKIECVELTGHPEQFARDLFILSFYLWGANMADLARLTPDNLKTGRVEYARQKTGKVYSVGLSEKSQAIFERYAGGPYCLPVLTSGLTETQIRTKVHTTTKNTNRALVRIAAIAGVEPKNLSFYSARHSFATGLKLRGASLAVISESLGHSNVRTTEGYLRRFDVEVLDEAAKLLQ